MTNFTKGPWVYDGEYIWADSIGGYVGNPNTEDMRSGECVAKRDALAQIRANGQLMAAAPELLEALQALLDMDIAFNRGPAVADAVEVARAAIKKATGEQA